MVAIVEQKASITCAKCHHPVTIVQMGMAVVVKSSLHGWVYSHIFHFQQPPIDTSRQGVHD
jgi:hypothetical protein